MNVAAELLNGTLKAFAAVCCRYVCDVVAAFNAATPIAALEEVDTAAPNPRVVVK